MKALFLPLTALCALVASPALAQSLSGETYPTRYVGGWEVYGWGEQCWMKKKFPDGGVVLYNWDEYGKESYFMAKNPRWGFIRDGQRYDIQLQVGSKFYSQDAGGYSSSEGPGISFFPKDAYGFRDAVPLARTLTLRQGGRTLGTWTMTGAPQAFAEMRNCADSLAAKRSNNNSNNSYSPPPSTSSNSVYHPNQ